MLLFMNRTIRVALPKGLVDIFEGATRNHDEVHYFAKVTNLDPGVGE